MRPGFSGALYCTKVARRPQFHTDSEGSPCTKVWVCPPDQTVPLIYRMGSARQCATPGLGKRRR